MKKTKGVTAMHTYTIFYIYDDRQEIMHSHDLNDAIDWLLDHNCTIVSAHDETGHKCWEYGGVCENE